MEDAIVVEASALVTLHGASLSALRLLACHERGCSPIPMQVDERDRDGRWVLDEGPRARLDDPPATLDDNDQLLWMASDCGARAAPGQLPAHQSGVELIVYDAIHGTVAFAYLLADAAASAPSVETYVHYDPQYDRIEGRHIGAVVAMGFVDGVPGYLSLGGSPNLLDRLKVRASARLIFGLLRFSRSEADLSTELAGWHSGPIRVIRGQNQRIRLGWGIRSPTFGSYTYFYRNAADLPVSMHLNYPATYWVSDVRIEAVLDFHNLDGWQVIVPSLPEPFTVGGSMTDSKRAVGSSDSSWFALRGPAQTLVQSLAVSPSLASTDRRLVYREGPESVLPPESVPGETPGIGFRLERWEGVGPGMHHLAARSWALPNDVDVAAFIAAQESPLAVRVLPILRP